MVSPRADSSNCAGVARMQELANAGFYVALRVGFAYPAEEMNELPKPWVAQYTQRGLMIHDPVIRWVYSNTGSARWSDLASDDNFGVLTKAREHGLNFGVAIGVAESDGTGPRSYGSFSRHDRELTEGEISVLYESVLQLHRDRQPPTNLTNAELEALRMVKDGLLMKEIAAQLGVTEGAVKQRLKNAKSKLRAKTGTHAATMATAFGII